LGTIWDVIGTCNRADAVEIGGQTYIAEKVIPDGSVVPVNPGGGEPVLIQICDTTLQTDWQNKCCTSALTSTDTTVVEVFPTMCCKKLKETNSSLTNGDDWKNKCCSVPNNGLKESEMVSYCCSDTHGNLYGGGHNDVCCTDYQPGSVCCRDDGTTVNGGNNASCCKWAGLLATGNSASNYCCANTNINDLSNPLNWRNGCCMRSSTYKYNETDLGCCSWRINSSHFYFNRPKNAYTNDAEDDCCTGGRLTGNDWLNFCCSNHYVNSVSGDLQKDCCRAMYDAKIRESFIPNSGCCAALNTDEHGRGDDGRYYSECALACKDTNTFDTENPYYNDQARQCCENGDVPDDDNGNPGDWNAYCCLLTDENNDQNSQWYYNTSEYYEKPDKKCCAIRRKCAGTPARCVYHYAPKYFSGACPGNDNNCSEYYEDGKFWCGEEVQCSMDDDMWVYISCANSDPVVCTMEATRTENYPGGATGYFTLKFKKAATGGSPVIQTIELPFNVRKSITLPSGQTSSWVNISFSNPQGFPEFHSYAQAGHNDAISIIM
jgi:hypothetical protein